jgi:putative DNA primase/helicase
VSATAQTAKALGGNGRSRGGWYAANCPVCGGEGKLGLKDTETGLTVSCFKLCRRADILAEIKRLGLLGDAAAQPEDPAIAAQRLAKEEDWRRQQITAARYFLGECLPWNTTSQIAQYLRRRGIDPSAVPSSIMWHGLVKHPEGGHRPLMVGVIEHVEFGIIGVSRTYLATDGSTKAAFNKPRLFLGLAGGGAVRLGSASANVELVVGEGIESTLSYMQMHRLPGWAALSANGIKSLVLPPEARRVVIAADNDESKVGVKAALAAARRWTGEMRRVRIDLPPKPGSDWNEVLTARAKVAA